MKFSLMLFLLFLKLRSTARKYPSFKERLVEKDFTLQIKTRDDSLGRYYIFNDGEVFTGKGIHTHPDVTLVWASADIGFRIMKAGDRDASLKAREDGDLVVEGDPLLAIGFNEIISQMRNPDASSQPTAARTERVAFIGLGNMGAGIARNLIRGGVGLTVYNRTESKMKPFIEMGAIAARSPREAAAGADFVFTSLMGDDSVLSVVESEDGLMAGMEPSAIHIGTSTISPACAMQLANLHEKHGSHYVSAPVLGRPDVAEAGQLVTFVAGDAAVIESCKPLFETYTRMVRVIPGQQGLANVTKLCANYTAASVIELMGQVYTFAEKSGLDPALMEDLFQTTWAHPGLKEYATLIRARDFDSDEGFAMSGGLKDVELMLSSSEAEGVTLEYAEIIKGKMLEGIEQGMANKDWSATYEVTRRHAGLT